ELAFGDFEGDVAENRILTERFSEITNRQERGRGLRRLRDGRSRCHRLLGGFDFVPDFVVLGAARNILPKVDVLLIFLDIIKMEILDLIWTYEIRGAWVRGSVAGHIGDFLLRSRLDHVLDKFHGEILVVTCSCDHQVVNPAGCIFFRNSLAYWEVDFAKLI